MGYVMPKIGKGIVLAVLLLLAGSTSASSGEDETTRPLAGAPWTVAVSVADLPADAAQVGLSSDALAREAAAVLAAAGFAVDPAAPDRLLVTVAVSPIRGAGVSAYSVQLDYHQPVILKRAAGAVLSAATWQLGQTGSSFSAHLGDTVLGTTRRLTQRFCNDFSAVNPPRK